MTDLKTTIKVLSGEIINMKQALDKFNAVTSKRLNDMQQTLSALETDLANYEKLSN